MIAKRAIPMVLAVLLLTTPRLRADDGYIGVQVKQEAAGMAILVQDVAAASPAADAGLTMNDFINKVDGVEVTTLPDFVRKIRATKPGDKITLTITRDNQEKEIKVTVGKNPSP